MVGRILPQLAPSSSGINPMNGSDAPKNPDGDGFDVNKTDSSIKKSLC